MSRLRIRRRPLVYWSLTGALAFVTATRGEQRGRGRP